MDGISQREGGSHGPDIILLEVNAELRHGPLER
ncbi:MAG: hypothetical protein RI897_3693 [Verrucomicrobiota bacterium]|jgi:hypothetical protein